MQPQSSKMTSISHGTIKAIRLDEFNSDKKWQLSNNLELDRIDKYETFLDIGKLLQPHGYK